MQSVDIISKVESFIISIPREVPYLGPLREGEKINEKGYVIRKGNRTIYPTTDMSVSKSPEKVAGSAGVKPMASWLRKR